MAKRTMQSLDFGGISKDYEVFRLALNMGSLVVVVLKLSGAGMVDVKATVVERTERLLLFDKDIKMKLSGEKAVAVGKPVRERWGKKVCLRVLASLVERSSQSITEWEHRYWDTRVAVVVSLWALSTLSWVNN
jgi:hypothetical protein